MTSLWHVWHVWHVRRAPHRIHPAVAANSPPTAARSDP